VTPAPFRNAKGAKKLVDPVTGLSSVIVTTYPIRFAPCAFKIRSELGSPLDAAKIPAETNPFLSLGSPEGSIPQPLVVARVHKSGSGGDTESRDLYCSRHSLVFELPGFRVKEQRDGTSGQGGLLTFDSGHRFSGLRDFIVLHHVMGGDGHLFEPTINLAQFPEDQNKNNHDYEQQEWDVHLFIFSSEKLETPAPSLN
jgi:hypothetical protein